LFARVRGGGRVGGGGRGRWRTRPMSTAAAEVRRYALLADALAAGLA